jgi:flagellar basal-body rod modification protein FlgD
MAITPTSSTTSLASQTNAHENPKGILGKDDFMKLLLVELQYQDPTAPMDTEKILAQTSQLATLESADNTNKSLEDLSKTLASSQQFSTIAAIGKRADLGSDAIVHDKDEKSTFELYFPTDVKDGSVVIKDNSGEVVKRLELGENASGVYQFSWDGKDTTGESVKSGLYHISATYEDSAGKQQQTKLGIYPIESVRFDQGKALLKLGTNYVALDKIKEIY